MITKLPYVLPDYTRLIWHSAAAKAVWGDRLSAINAAWSNTEREAVVVGVRASSLTFVDPLHLPEVAAWAAVRGLVVLPLGTYGQAGQYSATSTAVQAGRPWHYRIALTKADLIAQWADLWSNKGKPADNQLIGQLLGYPECCRAFFETVWVQRQGVDTTWQMAEGTPSADPHEERTLHVPASTPREANIMLRWLGVRAVPHLPCSFECAATVAQGQQYLEIMRRINPQAADWLLEMLDWPVEWSALHGGAEIRTPVLTISARTDATGEKYLVRKAGNTYPAEGARGLRFPFRIQTGQVTDKPSFKRSVQPVWELNGFSSEEGMKRAHDVLLSLLPTTKQPTQVRAPDEMETPHIGRLLDLGCGTGRLLERARDAGWIVSGLEIDSTRAGAATIPIRRGDLLDVASWNEGPRHDVIVFMPGRLLENVEPAKAEQVRQSLLAWSADEGTPRLVLMYAYGDWLTKHGSLASLVEKAGLGGGVVRATRAEEGVEAALIAYGGSLHG